LGREEGIFCGGSTGTNAWVALKVAETLTQDDVVVFIVCDTGERYLTKFHSDEWMKEKRLLGFEKMTLGLLVQTKDGSATSRLVSVTPTDQVSEALRKMNEYGFSQLPVLDHGESVGSVREGRLLGKVVKNRDLLSAPVHEVMEAAFPVVNANIEVEQAEKYLKTSPALLVEEYGRIIGIVTRYDVLDVQS
jgi:cystathionine beta-synthase